MCIVDINTILVTTLFGVILTLLEVDDDEVVVLELADEGFLAIEEVALELFALVELEYVLLVIPQRNNHTSRLPHLHQLHLVLHDPSLLDQIFEPEE